MKVRRIILGLVIAAVLAGGAVLADWWIAVPESKKAHFVGGAKCITCHADQHQAWKNSHHDLAMQVATPDTVLGDFNDQSLTVHDITSKMFRRDDKFFIQTEGPDGRLSNFEIKYCFGVEPLQQYMVELDPPREKIHNAVGRLQVLRISWDTQQKKWFYLPPPDVPDKLEPTDDLHWTGIAQRWNTTCADCHSTNLQKNFDPATLTYATTFSDINVNCEACHGPGSIHVDLATATSLFWDRRLGYGLPRLKDKDNAEPEIQSCAPCHSRRNVLNTDFAGGAHYFDHFGLELPTSVTYFGDGQILDEVYEYGSFLQSKMYHQKIRCSDCHDPHSAKLKHTGNAVCTSCHQHPPGKYDGPSHHQHRPASKGALCVECHMPETTYMEVDARRDHSLRVPRPDLSVAHGFPNACTGCHLDRAQISDEQRASFKQYRDWILVAQKDPAVAAELRKVDVWAAEKVEEWFPDSKFRLGDRHFGELLAGAWQNQPDAAQKVLDLVKRRSYPAVVRAAGWRWLSENPTADVFDAAPQALQDPSPLVRAAAARVFEAMIPTNDQLAEIPPAARRAQAIELRSQFDVLFELLEDPVRSVRLEAAEVLSRVPAELLPAISTGPQRESLQLAIDDLKHSFELLNDRAGGHSELALIHESQGDFRRAIAEYQLAIRVEPNAAGARSNLALLLEQMAAGSDNAEQLLTEAKKLRQEELALLARDARLAPEIAAVQYRYGMSLYLDGQHDKALAVLERAAALRPDIEQYALAVKLLREQIGK